MSWWASRPGRWIASAWPRWSPWPGPTCRSGPRRGFFRDDIGLRPVLPVAATEIPVDLGGAAVVLCDDVLYTGRTVRAALNALCDMGRPAAVQLAVMVDRGHREFPVRPDYVGKNLPTRRLEMVDVSREGVLLGDIVDGPAGEAP